VTDFNVDGFVDVEVKGVAAAVGVSGALDQIVFSPAAFYQTQPLGLRAVDASLKQFVGNSLDYFFNPEYFTEYAAVQYFTASYYWSTCGGGGVSGDVIVVDYSGSCFWVFQYLVGYYMDYTVFAGAAVAAWLAEQSIQAGQVSPSDGLDDIEDSAESVIGVEIGGWPMEEVLGSSGEHTNPNVRRGLEIFWAIIGIGTANAQEVETDEAPSQTARSFDQVYITGHHVFGGPTHTALEYTSTSVPRTTISAGPEWVDGALRLVSRTNRASEFANFTVGTVSDPGNPIAALYLAELLNADSNYDDNLMYQAFPSPPVTYNSNGYVHGLLNATGGIPSVNLNNFVGGDGPVPTSAFQ